MHRNENSWPKPNKMKHCFTAEGRIPNTVFQKFSPPCRPILLFFSLLHKLNRQNQLFTLLSCFTKKNYTSYQTLYQQSTIYLKINKLVKSYFLAIFETPFLNQAFIFSVQINAALLSGRFFF